MIISNVPHFLDLILALPPDDKARLTFFTDYKASTVGFRLGGEVFQVLMSVWREHYGARFRDRLSQSNALDRWQSDLRKSLPTRSFVLDTDFVSQNDRGDLPTAWERVVNSVLQDDDEPV